MKHKRIKLSREQVERVVKKVLYAKESSKAAKTKRGSALSQR